MRCQCLDLKIASLREDMIILGLTRSGLESPESSSLSGAENCIAPIHKICLYIHIVFGVQRMFAFTI